ncbi:ribosomal protein S18-alanine N-acetyltransferase [Roseicyclus marinus]|uniref:ribosomal protein S18-alanine N-acetyltransferase n=2 Tax=Roseicyclus marinus TaxID=2161673 RepID=UPI00240FF619|nr:ribosomal protein S18-alanine N-acetyltransferase [Roseicyclus marinus]
MTPARMARVHAAAFADHGQIWSETDLAALCAAPTTHSVAMDDMGFALIRVIAPEAEVLTIAVDPTAQGKGLGKGLLRAAMALAEQHGAETLFLEVAEDNVAARALYAGAGFTQTARRRGYYSRPGAPAVDAIVMTCSLSAEKSGKPCKN